MTDIVADGTTPCWPRRMPRRRARFRCCSLLSSESVSRAAQKEERGTKGGAAWTGRVVGARY